MAQRSPGRAHEVRSLRGARPTCRRERQRQYERAYKKRVYATDPRYRARKTVANPKVKARLAARYARNRLDPEWKERQRIRDLIRRGDRTGFAYEPRRAYRDWRDRKPTPWSQVKSQVRAAFRKKVFERDGYVCQVRSKRCTGAAEEIDHIVPISTDPSRMLDETNMRASCRACNTARRLGVCP